MIDLGTRRQVFAEEMQTCFNLRTGRLVDAVATVPREQFLSPGPWKIIGEGDYRSGGQPRQTPDGDPKHLYHNVSVAVDPARHLFNGAPGIVLPCIDALDLAAGARVLHIGCGLGYYSAVIGQTVGASGRVVALDVDEDLAAQASRNLATLPWVEVRHGDGAALDESFDAILVNAGVTHPHDAWLDGLSREGRLVVPLTVTMPQMGNIGKGMIVRMAKRPDDSFDASIICPMISIYSAVGLRDDTLNQAFGNVLQRSPFVRLTRFRRDAHESTPSCWYHAATFCFSS